MVDLRYRIDNYANFFKIAAAQAYNARGEIRLPAAPVFEEVGPAIQSLLEHKKEFDVLDMISLHADQNIPAIEAFLHQDSITGLSFLCQGTASAVLHAQTEKFQSRMLLRISPYIEALGNAVYEGFFSTITKYDRPWNPLVLQPGTDSVFENEALFSLELLPVIGMLPEKECRDFMNEFGDFLNAHILVGTPYRVNEGEKDLGLMRNGTPVYADPDCLNFQTAKLAVEHADNQFNTAWQQEIMGVIARNCAEVGWPEELGWVVTEEGGRFATRQSVLYTDAPSRSVGRRPVRLGSPQLN